MSHRDRKHRKQADALGENNKAEVNDNTKVMEENRSSTEKQGPTVPRNTGQRYAPILSPSGGESRHITFAPKY